MNGPDPARAEIVVDLAAIRGNVRRLAELASSPETGRPVAMMTVVKADGYGHGMVPVARAAREAGASWLGVATIDEALALRQAGDTGRVLCWLGVPGEDYRSAVAADVDVTAYTVAELDEIVAGTADLAAPARVQLKVDTGLSRGGAAVDDWDDLVRRAASSEREGRLLVTGVWSHFACSDEPDHPANTRQEQVFADALAVAARAGLRPEVRHLANSAGAVLRPQARYDLVRCGIASYGLTPAPDVVSSDELGLVPAMTVRARLALTKRVAAGEGVSYGHTYVTDRPTTLAVVPAGYGEGVPRHASNLGPVHVGGARRGVLGRVCMDQFVIDVDGLDVTAGSPVVLFGTGAGGEPTAQDWASAIGTISYEIVTRVGGRMPRRYVDSGEATGHPAVTPAPDREEEQ